ncbi:MAG: hypothetical protein GTO51_06665 [Candidatus Latescibacteria bacterium]|nr:hypothetical protein [Candidatus Latescibacterota bacterium]NIM21485.1 hypothetical protein [Candidatus Latescibacterota bacterium]NIM65656.1 hypothetical protein [Candidatus Latescibacterota bacterium]NIO02038.1 hypothetical protein [Candidatus Latescibacterota bacterium]NIO28850.1 hypothetical protein [Candidatus Latescibacterota bacterium]
MSRIVGAICWNEGEKAEDLVRRAMEAVPVSKNLESVTKTISSGPVALGLMHGSHSYTAALSEVSRGRYIVSCCGFIYGSTQIFRDHDLPPDAPLEENLASLYGVIGIDFLRLIPGMFSLSIYDRELKQLLVACDRSGFFPVYYGRGSGNLVFCSSIKAVRAATGINRMNKAAFAQHLFFDAQYGENTYYEDVSSLIYGGYLLVDMDKRAIKKGRYFRYEELFESDEYRRNRRIEAPRELKSHLKSCLGHIIEGQDQNSLGLLCGGGIDCSFVGSTLKEMGVTVPTFCLYTSDVEVQEADQAKELSDRLGTEFIASYMPRKKYYPYLLRNILTLDQPVVHPNLAGLQLGAKTILAKNKPNQILGVGSDLLFGGTGNVRSLYRYLKLRKFAAILPKGLRRLMGVSVREMEALNLELRMRNELSTVAAMGAGNFEKASAEKRIESALEGIGDSAERHVKILMLENLCDYQQHLLNRRFELMAGEGVSYYFPFLDIEMLRFAINLPVKHCVNWSEAKLVVRNAVVSTLGKDLADRPKFGGDVPIDKWIVPLKFLLIEGFVAEQLGFDPDVLMPIAENHPKLLWNLLDVELWGRLCVRDENPDDLLDQFREKGIECTDFEAAD